MSPLQRHPLGPCTAAGGQLQHQTRAQTHRDSKVPGPGRTKPAPSPVGRRLTRQTKRSQAVLYHEISISITNKRTSGQMFKKTRAASGVQEVRQACALLSLVEWFAIYRYRALLCNTEGVACMNKKQALESHSLRSLVSWYSTAAFPKMVTANTARVGTERAPLSNTRRKSRQAVCQSRMLALENSTGFTRTPQGTSRPCSPG